jgi:hypothetical protein
MPPLPHGFSEKGARRVAAAVRWVEAQTARAPRQRRLSPAHPGETATFRVTGAAVSGWYPAQIVLYDAALKTWEDAAACWAFAPNGEALTADTRYVGKRVGDASPDGVADAALVYEVTGTATELPLTTKGDLLTRDASALARLAAGADAYVLTADSTDPLGVRWALAGTGTAGYDTVQEEGTNLTQRSKVNFVGAALTAADDSANARTNVTLSQSPSASTSVVGTGRLLSTSSPLSGGGDLSADRTLSLTHGAGLTVTAGSLVFDAAWAAGAGLVPAGASALDVNPGDGVEVVADAVKVKPDQGLSVGAGGVKVKLGDGLTFGASDEVKASIGAGLDFATGVLVVAADQGIATGAGGVKVKLGDGLTFDASDNVKVSAGLGLDFAAGVLVLDSPVSVAHGGTGHATAQAAFDALSPTALKGDLIVCDGTNDESLSVGTDGQVLTADSTQLLGVKWAAAGGGGVPTTRTLTATAPVRIDGGGSADLSADRTISLDTVPAGSGGTGFSTYATGDLLVGAGGSTLGKYAYPGDNKALYGSAGTWTGGTLPLAAGGTGQTAKQAAMDALSPQTTKGDLVAFDGSHAVRKAPGADGTVLTADSAQADGLNWTAVYSATNPPPPPTPTVPTAALVFLGSQNETTTVAANTNWATASYTIAAGETLCLVVAAYGTAIGAPSTATWSVDGKQAVVLSASANNIQSALAFTSEPGTGTVTFKWTVATTRRLVLAFKVTGLLGLVADSLAPRLTQNNTGSTTPATGSVTSFAESGTHWYRYLQVGFLTTNGPVGDAAGTWGDSLTGTGQRVGTNTGTNDISLDVGYRNIYNLVGIYNASKSGITSRPWCIGTVFFK